MNKIPTIYEVAKFTNSFIKFVELATIGSSEDNWLLYRNLDESNYKTFVYSFAYEIGQINPKWNYVAKKLEKNSRYLRSYLEKKKIVLSPTEKELLLLATNFISTSSYLSADERHDESTKYQFWLCHQYGII